MRIDPVLPRLAGETAEEPTGRALVPVDRPRLTQLLAPGDAKSAARKRSSPFLEIASVYDVGAITPREMVDLSFELYVSGFLTREQYHDLAFQAELMPNFDVTIGALTGERADPDRPRDYTEVWRARLKFEEVHLADDPRIVERTRQILDLLLSIKSSVKHSRNPLARARRNRGGG